MPDVEDEDDAQLAARIERFVLDRVVEDERLAPFPVAGFGADTEPAAFGNDEWKVADQAGIADTDMRWNRRARRKNVA